MHRLSLKRLVPAWWSEVRCEKKTHVECTESLHSCSPLDGSRTSPVLPEGWEIPPEILASRCDLSRKVFWINNLRSLYQS